MQGIVSGNLSVKITNVEKVPHLTTLTIHSTELLFGKAWCYFVRIRQLHITYMHINISIIVCFEGYCLFSWLV
jgi:hypothetical protein